MDVGKREDQLLDKISALVIERDSLRDELINAVVFIDAHGLEYPPANTRAEPRFADV